MSTSKQPGQYPGQNRDQNPGQNPGQYTDRGNETLQAGGQPTPARLPALHQPPAPPKPRRKHRAWLWALAVGIGAGGGALAYLQPWTPAPASVIVDAAIPAPVTRLLAVNGRVEALHAVDLRSQVGGSLAEVAVAEGDFVVQGQALARVDSDVQEAVMRQSIAALDAALVAQEQADATYARSLALGANVSAAAREADRRAAQGAMQEVARVSAMLEQVQIQLARHTLRAPMAGTLVTVDAEVGQSVDLGTVLMTLADLDSLVVEADVDETYAGQIAVGQGAVLRLAGENATVNGRVSAVAARVDVGTGGLAVQITPDTPLDAPIGLTVTANIVVEQRDAALSVLRSALVSENGAPAVFVAQDGIARLRPVTVIDWPAARLIVTDGLAEGDLVIRDAAGLVDGRAIAPEAR